MATYVAEELPALVADNFPLDMTRQGVTGHSMGGHGALVHALRAPDRFRSVSAFAPIAAPEPGRMVARGVREVSRFRREDVVGGMGRDGAGQGRASRIPSVLIDQGTADPFLREGTMPHLFAEACEEAGIECALRMQPGYDHGYGFVSTFMADHIAWHAARLQA